MNALLNYVIEASICLAAGLLYYKLILANETVFSFQRAYLLAVLVCSVCLPLFHWQSSAQAILPSVSHVIPAQWLPEFNVNGAAMKVARDSSIDWWQVAGTVYILGVGAGVAAMVIQVVHLLFVFRRSKHYIDGDIKIVEADVPGTFSFFNHVFLSARDAASANERADVIRHELIHIKKLHSLDIVFIHVMKIVFWFNPCIYLYRTLLVEVHEFEADAGAVEDQDVDRYCSLLAKIALQSNGLSLANHFNNSLTLKRIQMMRTIKSNITSSKAIATWLLLPLLFVAIACQDQIVDELSKTTISQAEMPDEVKADIAALKAKYPQTKFTYVEGASDEVRKHGNSAKQVMVKVYDYGEKLGVIFKDVAEMNLQDEDGVFTVVEQQPEFTGGYNAMVEYLQNNVQYPEQAKSEGKSGTVYVQFVVDNFGKIVDPRIIRGVSKALDEEAVRVVALMPDWKPGMQNGQAVKTRFVLPIKFDAGYQNETPEDKHRRP